MPAMRCCEQIRKICSCEGSVHFSEPGCLCRYPFKKSYNDTYVMDVSGYDAMRSAVPLEPEDADFETEDEQG